MKIMLNEKQTLPVFFLIRSNPDRTPAQVVKLFKESRMQIQNKMLVLNNRMFTFYRYQKKYHMYTE